MSEKTASLTRKKTRGSDIVLLAAIYVSASVSVLLLAGIIGYVFVKGVHTVNWTFLTSVTSALKNTVGIAGNLVNTLYIIVITLLIVTPLGVGAAIYLNEYAKPGKLDFSHRVYNGNAFGYSFYYIWTVRYDFFRTDTALWILHPDRFPYTDADGTSPDHQKYPGSPSHGTGQLS